MFESCEPGRLSDRQGPEEELLTEILAAVYELTRATPGGGIAARRNFIRVLGRLDNVLLDNEVLEPRDVPPLVDHDLETLAVTVGSRASVTQD